MYSPYKSRAITPTVESLQLLERRDFLKLIGIAGAGSALPTGFPFCGTPALVAQKNANHSPRGYAPGRIPNEFSLYLPGEEESLKIVPSVSNFNSGSVTAKMGAQSAVLRLGESLEGWKLVAIADMNGVLTAVFEKHVTHRGAIAYVTEGEGTIAWLPKQIGSLSVIRPRPTNTPQGVKLERAAQYVPGPDVTGEYLLNSSDDPCYENVAALGPEYIGWTLVANEQGGPATSLYLEADGKSREIAGKPDGAGTWEPDQLGAFFDPAELLPGEDPQLYEYVPGYSKRTLLGGYLPVADIGVWNPKYECGYEVMVLLPPGPEARPMARVRAMLRKEEHHAIPPDADGRVYIERYWNCNASEFFSALAGIWNGWSTLYESSMPVEVPDAWLVDAARAGITLSRCSYRGLEPTYQIGEGAYTKVPERSHALFPVAHYEFIWAQQLWNLNHDADVYAQYYLDKYILPDGNFVYNTQDQVEAPLNTGIFLMNSARSYDYTSDAGALRKRLPVLERMIGYVLERYEYSKRTFAPNDRRYGLIYGSPEADLGDPNNDFPNSHPLYYQNSACIWRGLREHARCLKLAAQETQDEALLASATHYEAIAKEMRANIQASLEATLALRDPEMKAAGITPFTPDDIHRLPKELSSYENHRFMQDWFLADWGDPSLDTGHLRHREIAGMQILGLHTDGAWARTSNFMDHGSLAVKIRQEDYRPFLLNLYALVCYAADSGNRYAPEDAMIPGSFPGEGSRYGWASVINSTLQPAMGLRWLLCYEESDADVCHLQKAAPKHWFASSKRISVKRCPTRFGSISWETKALSDREWKITLDVPDGFTGDIRIHIHTPDGEPLQKVSLGTIEGSSIRLDRAMFSHQYHVEINAT
jgi:hypothetical protein